MKKNTVLTVIVTVLLIFTSLPAQETGKEKAKKQARRPMTADDALNIIGIGNALISPCGQWAFFSKSTLNWNKNKRESKYYMVSTQGGEPFQYIGEAGGSSFQFSPDGKYLSFKRTVENNSQIFLMPTNGGEGVQLTKHKNSVGSYKWSPDSQRIFFTASESRSPEEEKKYKAGYDAIFVDEGSNGQRQGSWRNLWMFDVKSKKETKITDEKFLVGGFDISPCGEKILFTSRYSNRRNDGYKTEIYLVSTANDDKKIIRLTENNSPESSPTWAPDGKSFAYLAADDKDWTNRNSKVFIMNPENKKYRLLSQEFEGSIRGLTWTPDSQYILFNGQQRTNSNLYRISAANGKYTQISNVSGIMRIGPNCFSRDKSRIVYTFTDFDSPSDLYSSPVENFSPVRLTNANPWMETELLLASMRIIRWKSKKNFEIEGILHLPAGFKADTRLPLMLNIHGGPAGCFTNSFRASYHIYAGLGYASLSPNVRGSSGYTDKLREGNTIQAGDGIGLGDYWDLMNGVDHVIEMGIADPERLALRGWSYGGILGGWTITQTDRFKAASIGAGVYDWSSEYGPGFNHDVRLWHIGGTPWDNPQAWRQQSAYTHVKNITTPTFLIHGINDPTDTESQSMLFYTAIKDIGKAPVRYIRVPREPHGFREPRHQRTRDIEEIRWMQKHVMGLDWKPWERAEDKKEEEKEKKKEEEKIK